MFIHFLPFVFFPIVSLRDLFFISLRASLISLKFILRSFHCSSEVLEYSVPAVVGALGSSG